MTHPEINLITKPDPKLFFTQGAGRFETEKINETPQKKTQKLNLLVTKPLKITKRLLFGPNSLNLKNVLGGEYA